MMAATEPFIRLRNVRKVYRSREQEFLAVSDVTMDVQEGELISLVGPSGCGKTTVLKILAGLHDADGGTIQIGNARTPFNPARVAGMLGRREEVFAITVTVLAAKLCKCDGPVKRSEIDAFKRNFRIPPASARCI